jgi:hypothetical protein
MVYDLWDDEKNSAFVISEGLTSNIGFDMTNTWKFLEGTYDEENKVWTVRPSIIQKAISE